MRIFVVENHTNTLTYLKRYLEQLGHVVFIASGVAEALEMLPAQAIDIFISDIGLSDGDGWELMQRAKLPETVYAIAMSGYGLHNDRTKSLAVGYRHHLMKPFTPSELDAVLDEAAKSLGTLAEPERP